MGAIAFAAPIPPPCKKCGARRMPEPKPEPKPEPVPVAKPAPAPKPKPEPAPKPAAERKRGQRITSPLQMSVGERYHSWTVLEPRASVRHALCRCDCGTERRVWRQSLQSGTSTSCGSCGIAPGAVRGHWRIVAPAHKAGRKRYFAVECIVCGHAKTVERSNWYNGFRHIACKPSKVEVGSRWGRWTVIATGKGGILCRCDCGTERRLQVNKLWQGETKSCGCALADARSDHGAQRVGQTYGDWTVDSYRKTGKGIAYAIRCVKCGHTTERRYSHFALTRSHCSACSPKPRHTKRIDLAAK